MSRHHTGLNPRCWTATRKSVFQRDGYRCRKCGRAGRLEAHHIQPLEHGGDLYDLENILTYCRLCHIAEHKTDRMTPGRREWLEFVQEFL